MLPSASPCSWIIFQISIYRTCLFSKFMCKNYTTMSGFLLHFAVPLSCSEGFTELGYYNGTVSQTDSGSPCLKWTEFPDYVQQYPGRGLGEHNYCRNPDRESNPWCFFRQSSGAIGWAYCDCHQGKPDCPTSPSPFYHNDVVFISICPSSINTSQKYHCSLTVKIKNKKHNI